MNLATAKSIIRHFAPLNLLLPIYNTWVRVQAARRGYHIAKDGTCFRIRRDGKEMRLARSQGIYLKDTIDNFDFYFSGVEPERIGATEVVDYSLPRWHRVKNFSMFPVYFPSVAEPIETTLQYVEFAGLGAEAVAIDLGAYSGLSSILFDQAISLGGKVIAVEADAQNIAACEKNFARYREHSGRTIELVKAAIWRHDCGVNFSSEGSMGSSAVDIVGSGRGKIVTTPTLTLDSLAEKYSLSRVDFIKCDIEGAETEIFDRPRFFEQFAPRIMVECHAVEGTSTLPACRATLEKYGYRCEEVSQVGYPLPLLACTPLARQPRP